MAAPNPPLAPHAVDPLDVGVLYAAVFACVSHALTRMGCPEADREDVAQRVILKAYQRRHQYDDARGTPAGWLWGIARNELHDTRRGHRRDPLLALIDLPPSASDERADALALEDIVLVKDLADFVWKGVPKAEQRVIWERVMGGSTFDEIAELQGISKSRAQRLYNKGMSRLRAALTRADERKLFGAAVPFAFVDLFDLSHGPPVAPEVLERGWQAMLVEMGRDEGSPPRCAPAADGDAPPSSQPRVGQPVLRHVLGPIAGIVAGVLLAGPILSRCDRDHGSEERPAAALAALAAMPIRDAVGDSGDPSPAAYLASRVGPSLAPIADGAGDETERSEHRPAPGSDARLPDEWSLIRQARASLATHDPTAALATCDEHARRFPKGRFAVRREALRAQACARLFAVAPGDPAQIDARCAAKR